MLQAFKGKDSFEAVERDDGFLGLSGGAKAYFAEYKDWSVWQRKAIKFAKGKVLDVGSGAGRVGVYLQGKGLHVTSIDNSPAAIEVCKKRGLKDSLVLSINDIHKFKPKSFDTIVMFGNNFGLFQSYKKAKVLLKKLHKITSSNALIIAESNDPYKTDDLLHLKYQKFNRKRGRMSGQLRIRVRFKHFVGPWFDYLLVSKKEMQDILNGTGWKVRKYFDSGRSVYIAVIEKEDVN